MRFFPHAGKITLMASSKSEIRIAHTLARPHSSSGLTNQLEQLVRKLNPKLIASYVPYSTEPDISGFNNAHAERVVLPRVVGEKLEFASGELIRGSFGILEPQGPAINPGLIELIFVPALAADSSGNRLGKGKGFYDRFLANLNCPKVAVVFASELIQGLEIEEHDQRVDFVVTPETTIEVI